MQNFYYCEGNHKNKVFDVVERKTMASSVMCVVRSPSEKTELTPSPITKGKRSKYMKPKGQKSNQPSVCEE